MNITRRFEDMNLYSSCKNDILSFYSFAVGIRKRFFFQIDKIFKSENGGFQFDFKDGGQVNVPGIYIEVTGRKP